MKTPALLLVSALTFTTLVSAQPAPGGSPFATPLQSNPISREQTEYNQRLEEVLKQVQGQTKAPLAAPDLSKKSDSPEWNKTLSLGDHSEMLLRFQAKATAAKTAPATILVLRDGQIQNEPAHPIPATGLPQ